MTNSIKDTIFRHRKRGKITEGLEVIAKFERAVDAHVLETKFHQRGYNGFYYGGKG